MIKAVLFDLYETLITEWNDNNRITAYSDEELGIETSILKNEWKLRITERMNGTFPDYKSTLIDILQKQDLPINVTDIETIAERRKAGKSLAFEKIENEILQTLRGIKEKGLKIALISNCMVEEVDGWASSALPPFFDDVIFSYKIGLAKPEPAIYLKACERLNVSPEECLFVGDGGSNELAGAKQVGIQAYHATWFQPSYITEKIQQGCPKLEKPEELLKVI